jgi:N-acetyl-gamma-glutamyl-phosphate reductase
MPTAAVLGASGYGGGELIRFLDNHPHFEIAALMAHSSAGSRLSDVHPHLSRGDRVLEAFNPEIGADVDVAFLAMPHGASATPAMQLLKQGVKVVDLGSDFRLDSPERYLAAYGAEHPYPDELGGWTYGLPELFADAVRGADRVAAPGCYPTSVILPVAPLLGTGLVRPTRMVVNSMSGVSGAGRGAVDALRFGAIDESVKAYNVFTHRHQPEMVQALAAATGIDSELTFTPHLVPMQRGILSTIHLEVNPGTTRDDFLWAFSEYYGSAPFMHLLNEPPETRWVVGSNNALVSYHLNETTHELIALSAIDNLVKGAAGQAIQCANLMFGFDETAGLPVEGWMP